MNAFFLTKNEALEFIKKHFGENVIIRNNKMVDDSTEFDINEVPFPWSGETEAFEVNNGEAYIAYWEGDAVYTIKFHDFEVKSDCDYRARQVAEQMKEVAEDCNISGKISVSDGYEIFEEIEVDLYDEEEPEGNIVDFKNAWKRAEIGQTIRKARTAKGLSIRELAKIADMSKNNIERIENGAYNYTIDNLNAIASALDITLTVE